MRLLKQIRQKLSIALLRSLYEVARTQVAAGQKSQVLAQIARAQANISNSEVLASYTQLRAPLNGQRVAALRLSTLHLFSARWL